MLLLTLIEANNKIKAFMKKKKKIFQLEAEVLPCYLLEENQLLAFLIMMCLVTQSKQLTTVVYHLVLRYDGFSWIVMCHFYLVLL